MKKLIFGERMVQVEESVCDYCGEEKEKCFQSVTGVEFPKYTGSVWALRDGVCPTQYYEKRGGGLFTPEEWVYVIPSDDYKSEHLELISKYSRIEKEIGNTHICGNCAKQIAAYVRNQNKN